MSVLVEAPPGSVEEVEAAGGPGRLHGAVIGICAVAIVASAALNVLYTQDGEEIFHAGAVVKSVMLPAVYAVLLVAALRVRRSDAPHSWPASLMWVPVLVGVLVVSTGLALTHPGEVSVLSLGQDLAMFGGQVLGVLAAALLGATSRLPLARILTLAAAGLAVMPQATPPFAGLVIPGAFAALVCWRSASALERVGYLALWGLVGAHIAFDPDHFMTGAHVLQFGGTAVTLLAIWWIRATGPSIVLVAVIALLLGGSTMLFAPGQQLVGLGSDTSDVTIYQRSYETAKVTDDNGQSFARTLVGGGPGATVDLTLSPDAATLDSAGRDLTKVDDAHLLSTHLMLKFGVAGLAWLGVLLACLIGLIHGVGLRTRDAGSVALAALLVGIMMYGVTAATNFLADPLFGVIFGTLAFAQTTAARSD